MMDQEYYIEIYGPLTPQKQTRFSNGKCYDPSKKDSNRIKFELLRSPPKSMFKVPVSVEIDFYLPCSLFLQKKIEKMSPMEMNEVMPDKKPDIDNLAYLVVNAMKGIVYDDDARICELLLRKKFCWDDPNASYLTILVTCVGTSYEELKKKKTSS